jgi:hypothetical protein
MAVSAVNFLLNAGPRLIFPNEFFRAQGMRFGFIREHIFGQITLNNSLMILAALDR